MMIMMKTSLSLRAWIVCMASLLLPRLISANSSEAASLFDVGWRDAYAYSHKWGYYRGYHEASARQIENHEKKEFLLQKAQRAPPPKASTSNRSSQYLRGWEVAHKKAAQRGYNKGWAAAQAGESYNARDDTHVLEPPPNKDRRIKGLAVSVASLGTSAVVLVHAKDKNIRPRPPLPPPPSKTRAKNKKDPPPPPPPPSKTDPPIHEASKKKKDDSIQYPKQLPPVDSTKRIKRAFTLAMAIVLLDFAFWIYDSINLLP